VAVAALQHGLEILDLFSADERVLGVGEIARRLGMHKSSASRLAATLSAAGYLEPADDGRGRYRLGPKLVRLAALAGDSDAVPRVAVPILERLVARAGDTGHVATLDGTEVVTIAVVDGWRSVRMHSTVGKRSPAHATAIGKVLLAALPDAEVARRYGGERLERRTRHTIRSLDGLLAHLHDVRERGWAADGEELEPGLRCVAAPVADHTGAVVAAVGLSGPAERITAAVAARLGRDVRATAAEVSGALGAPARGGSGATARARGPAGIRGPGRPGG
jgi:DNA-binding IclR family transcriptional regulator